MGIELDVGEFPEHTVNGDNSDPQQIERLTAHLVARIGDRFAFVRKLSRHLEGQEKRAGLLSDVFSVLVALYKRNPDVFENLSRQFASDLSAKRQAAKASSNGNQSTSPEGVVHNAS